MDIIDINSAANKAIDELSKNGQIGREIKNINILLSNTSVDVNDEEEGIYFISFPDSILQKMLEISATSTPPVTVIFDGKRYENVGTIVDEDGMSAFAIGNMGLLGGVNTGEPFLYIVASVGDTLVCVTRGTHTIELRYETVTVKPIDPKYVTTILDLTKFECEADGVTQSFNDVLQQLFQERVQAGGGLKTAEVTDIDGKLRAAASGNGNLGIQLTFDTNTILDLPTIFVHASDGAAAQIAAVGMMAVPPIGTLEMKMFIQFSDNSTDANIGVYTQVLGT